MIIILKVEIYCTDAYRCFPQLLACHRGQAWKAHISQELQQINNQMATTLMSCYHAVKVSESAPPGRGTPLQTDAGKKGALSPNLGTSCRVLGN